MESNKKMNTWHEKPVCIFCFFLFWIVNVAHADEIAPFINGGASPDRLNVLTYGSDTLSGPVFFDITPREFLIKSQQTASVGSPSTTFEVNTLGAAVYSVEIDAPTGGALSPHISLTYNSQGDYGLAGYGFNITGISSITRAPHTLWQDGAIKGVDFTAGGSYNLDGKRLVLISGKAGRDGAIYSPLGNPQVKVTLHGWDHPNTNMWFEVCDETGKVSLYGNDNATRIMAVGGSQRYFLAWYMASMEDRRGNTITYNYTAGNYVLYPKSITYGTNKNRDRGISCQISFGYESLEVPAKSFQLGPVMGCVDKRLANITTSVNSQIYRKYTLSYDTTSDKGHTKFARLKSVTVCNGAGQSMLPVRIDWNIMPSADVLDRETDWPTDNSTQLFEEASRNFIACDLNNDGISDIVRISQIDNYDYRYPNAEKKHQETWLFANLSSRVDGIYDQRSLQLPKQASSANIQVHISSLSTVDVDGDGYNDLVLPYFIEDGHSKGLCFHVVYGKELAQGRAKCHPVLGYQVNKDCSSPLIATSNFSGNGKSELFSMSDAPERDGTYNACMMTHVSDSTFTAATFSLTLLEKPRKVFTGDYNSDGLVDLLFTSDNKYTIFYNQGGKVSDRKFSDQNKYTGVELTDKWRLAQGDFDGDGRIDFVYPDGRNLNIAFNQGNGGFRIVKQVATLDLGDGKSTKDNDKYTLLAFDQDGDGKSDVFACNAYYEYHGFPKWNYSFNRGCATWLYSTGESLIPYKQVRIDREEDLRQDRIFLGDFDGNGILEVANCGGSLNGATTSDKESIHVYDTNNSNMAEKGRVRCVTDGYGKTTRIDYLPGTNPSVYDSRGESAYPIANCTLPLSLVSSVTDDGGASAAQTINYGYGRLQLHLRGEGVLGFGKVTRENKTAGIKDETEVMEWDVRRFVPTKTRKTVTIGNDESQSLTTVAISERADGNYFPYVSRREDKDWYGNDETTTNVYDLEICQPASTTTTYGGVDMYKKTQYSGYVNKGGVWLPGSVTSIQKHEDDKREYALTTTYEYNDFGETTEMTEASNTSLPLQHHNTYDDWGNVISSFESGTGVMSTILHKEYDATGRFVSKAYNTESGEMHTYTYDLFGNVLTENDCSNVSKPLCTANTYDGWGNRLTAVDPFGRTTKFITDWGNSNDKRFYVQTSAEGSPFVRSWYDACGKKVFVESVGRGDKILNESFIYDDKGRVAKKVTADGRLTITQTLSYDDHGRVASEKSSAGQQTSYTYGNRMVTTTRNSRSWTCEKDAWGNNLRCVDPLGGEVSFTYNSNGKPARISANGTATTFEYDDAGNQTALVDPDAGRTEYTYSADGKILLQTDARGVEMVNTYDAAGRMASVKSGDMLTTYTYVNSGNGVNQLAKVTADGGSVEYDYDEFGRKARETRNVLGQGSYVFGFTYNDAGQLSETTYPGDLKVSHSYDKYGFLTSSKANERKRVSLLYDNGLEAKWCFDNKLCTSRLHDDKGYPKSYSLLKEDEETGKLGRKPGAQVPRDALDRMSTSFDYSNGNLFLRQRIGESSDRFDYDDLDRLTRVYAKSGILMDMSYDFNGNISTKSGIGAYSYSSMRPHAVFSVDNSSRLIPMTTMSASYNGINKVSSLSDQEHGALNFTYGPDGQRWTTQLRKDGKTVRTIVYADAYEKVTENGVTREFYYLDGNTIVIKQNGTFTSYVAFTDYQGNILSVFDENVSKVFDAEYDAWGKQTIRKNDIGLIRGYTGHEMLDDFGVINMNGRLYDPVLGVFFSPDNNVQAPSDAQSYNRYTYCLNNPLKYTDPNGEFWELAISAAIGGVMNWASHGFRFNASGLGYFVTGAAGAAVTTGVAGGVNVAMTGGNFWQGAAGMAGGVSSTGFLAGAVSGASAGFAGGLVSGVGNSLVEGNSIGRSFLNGLTSGGFGSLSGGVTGGLTGGADALDMGTSYWTGKAELDLNGAYSCSGCIPSDFTMGESTITGKYVGNFQGVNVFESRRLGNIRAAYSAVTIPERGIIAADGVFSSQMKKGLAMIQHEYGHILQYRKVGTYFYYSVIAKESLANCMFDKVFKTDTHSSFWTETWANYLSKNYFGNNWLGRETKKSISFYYPSKKPSLLLRLIKFDLKGLFF